MSDMQPGIESGKRLSVIWILPLVALLIGMSLVVQHMLTQGPEITISFEHAEGLEAGKTRVQLLNVEVGMVTDIHLNRAKQGVVVTVQLDKDVKELLREQTRFWVVRARIGAGMVSGLGTLVSGAYIELAPGEGAVGVRHFTGLETPPLTPVGTPGVKLNLYSEQAGSVSPGDRVLYNGYTVGRIEGMAFDHQRGQIRFDAFIDAPYDQLVTRSVRFWDVSGIGLSASAKGIELQTESLDSIVLGAVAFAVPEGMSAGPQVDNGTDFILFPSFSEVQKRPFRHRLELVMAFSQSLRGLVVDAPVEYRGIRLGSVRQIMADRVLTEAEHKTGSPIPVLVSINPGRLSLPDTRESVALLKQMLQQGVEKGLRASLERGNLITGSLFISFDFYEDTEPAEAGDYSGYMTVPTIAGGLGRMEAKLNSFLDTLNALPLEQTVGDVDSTLLALTRTLDSLERLLSDQPARQLTAELNATLAELRNVLAGLSPGSEAFQSLSSSIHVLNETLHHVEAMTRTLSDKPNSLVLPTEFPDDPIPRASGP